MTLYCNAVYDIVLHKIVIGNPSHNHKLAKHLGKERAVVSHTLQLAQLSPEIIHLALIGALPEYITLKSLKTSIPADREEQKKFLRIE